MPDPKRAPPTREEIREALTGANELEMGESIARLVAQRAVAALETALRLQRAVIRYGDYDERPSWQVELDVILALWRAASKGSP